MRRWTDIALVAVLALIAGGIVEALPDISSVPRVLLGIPLVLLLPGYALSSALFRAGELRLAEQLAVSIAASLSVAIVSALLMNALQISLDARPWAAVLTAVTLAAAVVAQRRGGGRELRLRRPRMRVPAVVAVTLSLLLLSGAGALALTPLAAPKGTQGQVALWLVPAPHGSGAACVGVISDELTSESFTVALRVGRRAARSLGPFTLAPGGRWTRQVSVGNGNPPLRAVLHTPAGVPAAVRTVTLTNWRIPTRSC